jgi:hypothetical protein
MTPPALQSGQNMKTNVRVKKQPVETKTVTTPVTAVTRFVDLYRVR